MPQQPCYAFRLTDGCLALHMVSFEQFADFVRGRGLTSHYWDEEGSWRFGFRGEAQGDVLLRRIGFRWERRHEPVTGLSWFECQAYAQAAGARLPWWQDIATHTRHLHDLQVPEWCGDWYNPNFHGPDAGPSRHRRGRRVERFSRSYAVPEHKAHGFGFRLVHPYPPSRDVELVAPAPPEREAIPPRRPAKRKKRSWFGFK